ncbi:MAG TPA: hypothetical protein VNY36_08750, partial [Bacteroidia bacterium]|nr:hypothetical protein [Bacteroidia bacterium]
LSFSRKIISMGIIKDVPTRYVSTYNPIWFSPNGMDEVFKNKEQLSLYKELINSALYRRLHLTYPRQY